jgi:hypothetical protein
MSQGEKAPSEQDPFQTKPQVFAQTSASGDSHPRSEDSTYHDLLGRAADSGVTLQVGERLGRRMACRSTRFATIVEWKLGGASELTAK